MSPQAPKFSHKSENMMMNNQFLGQPIVQNIYKPIYRAEMSCLWQQKSRRNPQRQQQQCCYAAPVTLVACWKLRHGSGRWSAGNGHGMPEVHRGNAPLQ
jgi:hypothetical protein